MDIQGIKDALAELVRDTPAPKNVRVALFELVSLFDSDKEPGVKIDIALQKVEDLSMDPNLSAHTRTRLWELTSLLESVLS